MMVMNTAQTTSGLSDITVAGQSHASSLVDGIASFQGTMMKESIDNLTAAVRAHSGNMSFVFACTYKAALC